MPEPSNPRLPCIRPKRFVDLRPHVCHQQPRCRTKCHQYYGASIDLTVMAGAFTVGSISLGPFNPAAFTSMLTFSGKLAAADVWMHIVPRLLAAAVPCMLT
tara:strand:- start:3123 stop:3425 length:303 start_codon:yes stop_codon:yes gene_type:complete